MDVGILADAPCAGTVGLLRGLFLGVPDGACVELDLSIWGLGLTLLLFVSAVTALQWGVKRLLRGRGGSGRRPSATTAREAGNMRRAQGGK